MRVVIALASALVIGCGTDKADAGDSDAPKEQQHQTEPGPDQPPPPLSIPYSMALDSAADLPACDKDHQSQLVYLLAEQEFRHCRGAQWLVVDIRGPQGDKGDSVVGPKGDKGESIVGPAGAPGKDAPQLSANEWIDPATGKRWLAGSTATLATAQCPSGYILPTGAELSAAITSGIYTAYASLIATNSTYACGIEVSTGGKAIKPGATCTTGSTMGVYCSKL